MSMEGGLPAKAERLPRLKRPDVPRPGSGIVHLGLGAFYRSHGAIYIYEAMQKSGGDWGIVGVNLMTPPKQREIFEPQGFAYTAVSLAPEGIEPQVIPVLNDVLDAPDDPEAVLTLMADPKIKIVTSTVTEKGYCHFPSTGKLNREHPFILEDLKDENRPKSALGYIVRALDRRRKAGVRPFTMMSSDNLPNNGHVVHAVVVELAGMIDPELQAWIEKEVTFPCTMIDRIVPATKPEDIERVAELTGVYDPVPVMHEPFRQWVVEDKFVDGERPDIGAVGAQLVEDVTPFEHMKLRCLNGTHSSISYLGYLAGKDTIYDTVSDTVFAAYCKFLWEKEIIPAVDAPPGVSLKDYTAALFERYSNPSIRHLTWQIAMDGSQKLPQRILETVQEDLDAGRPVPGLSLAIAAWMRYVGGIDERGNPIDVRDPLAEKLKALSDAGATPRDKVTALIGVSDVFPKALQDNNVFVEGLVAAYEGLVEKGARAMAEAVVR